MKNNNRINVPEAREAMDKFKMEAAMTLMYLHHLKTNLKIHNEPA